MRYLKNMVLRLILTISAAACLFMLIIPMSGVVLRCLSAVFGGVTAQFWIKWLPSHLLNTVVIAAASVFIALPLGMLCALYLILYSGKRVSAALRMIFSALCSVPTAVYGLFGFFLFSRLAVLRYTVAAGIITIAVMLLGTAAQCCATALEQVDEKLTDASRALGATEYETVKGVLLPCAANGIVFCAILCLSRAAGESAALIFTGGTGLANTSGGLFGYLFSSGATLAVGIYQAVLNGELQLAFAACGAVMLMMTVFDILTKAWSGGNDRD